MPYEYRIRKKIAGIQEYLSGPKTQTHAGGHTGPPLRFNRDRDCQFQPEREKPPRRGSIYAWGGLKESAPTKEGKSLSTTTTYTKAIRLTLSCGGLAHAGRGRCSSPVSRPVCALNPRTPRPLWPLPLFAAAISAVSFARNRARSAALSIATSEPTKSGSRGFSVRFCFREFIHSTPLPAISAHRPNYHTKSTHRPSLDRFARSFATRRRTSCESPPRARRVLLPILAARRARSPFRASAYSGRCRHRRARRTT